jgi:CDGSH-type Zn-finger protein
VENSGFRVEDAAYGLSIMEDRIICDRKPQLMTLAAGDYWWCSCGRSKTQPFCDGSHKGTGLAPVKFTLTEEKTVAMCACKHSGKEPFCDGSHAKLPE